METNLSLLKLLLVLVDLCGKVSEETYNGVADLIHLVVELFHILDTIQDQCLGLMLTSLYSGKCPLLHYRIEGLPFLKLSIVLGEEVFQVIESYICILIRVLHVSIEIVNNLIEH